MSCSGCAAISGHEEASAGVAKRQPMHRVSGVEGGRGLYRGYTGGMEGGMMEGYGGVIVGERVIRGEGYAPPSDMCQCTTETPMMESSPLSWRTISVRWAQGQARLTKRW